ncbi:MAG: restriction endonuclease [Elusimicrobiota bacterium]|jgi:DNA modification methylase|nr:restriction endonuclease [Elusimicrobiota bacterium]
MADLQKIKNQNSQIKNQLILGDNLQVLRQMPKESADLIYIDPPFFSQKNYEVIWGDDGEIGSFTDRWAGGIMHYIEWLKERIDEMWRVLKTNGILCVHCDWHANAYIRVYILDKLYGGEFVNEIVWSYKRYTAASKKFQNLHDTIFCYSKNDKYIFNELREEYGQRSGKADGHYRQDIDGRWFRWQKRKDAEPYKIYLSEGRRIGDVWEMPIINASAKERIGYPTQKPEELLERIIKAFSNKNDLVLDAFCGGGTACAVARRLERHFIGIDQSVRAIAVSNARLENQTDLVIKDLWEMRAQKYDYEKLFNMNPFEFETFIVSQFGGEPNAKQRSDSGKDGVKREKSGAVPIQVKQQTGVGRPQMQSFIGVLMQSKVKKGYFIAFDFAKSAVEYVAEIKQEHGIEIELVKVSDIVPLIKPPIIKLDWEYKDAGDKKEIAFTASGKNISLWQWDLNYDSQKGFSAEIAIDREGKQKVLWGEGTYQIAVRAVDADGISAMETIQIRVNGGVKKETKAE